jgi:hypothetical protein
MSELMNYFVSGQADFTKIREQQIVEMEKSKKA